MLSLSADLLRTRAILVDVAAGKARYRRPGVISYKELWEKISDEPWNRFRTRAIVDQITTISAYEVERKRPPLNEIVIPVKGKEPRESWKGIRAYVLSTFGVALPYTSHAEAKQACLAFWRGQEATDARRLAAAEEGFRQDRSATFIGRNAALIAERKRFDDYRCQACGFRLKVNGRFIIDCHHITPLGTQETVVVTTIEDLVCLCPTCHRIAHSRPYPLSALEIAVARKPTGNRGAGPRIHT